MMHVDPETVSQSPIATNATPVSFIMAAVATILIWGMSQPFLGHGVNHVMIFLLPNVRMIASKGMADGILLPRYEGLLVLC